jgi:hypothetical protein
MTMLDYLAPLLALVLLLLALDLVAARWGEDSRHQFGDRNW